MVTKAFFAYPDGQKAISDAVESAVEQLAGKKIELKPWKKLPIVGLKIDDLIREELDEAHLLVADITYPNFNVFYEIGYAVGRGKPVLPTLNSSIERAAKNVGNIGLFDTIGWAEYANGGELATVLDGWRTSSWANKFRRDKDHSQPMFILDCAAKTDFRNHIIQTVENSHVKHRSFDPAQNPRLTASQAVADVSASAGVIIPILAEGIQDNFRHNLRAAFLIGLSHGFDLQPLAIQYEKSPAPLDYRDFITNSTFRLETIKHVEEYCAETLIWNQRTSRKQERTVLGLLGQIDLGSPTAENETTHLAEYFVKTAEYARAERAEGAVVIGRKGSGKSAAYFQLVDSFLRIRRRAVVELRPASHNLSEMREELLSVVKSSGVFDHTIAAFWQYVLYMEILLKVRESILPKSRNDFQLQERIRAVEDQFSLSEAVVSGDFTSRLSQAIDKVILALRDAHDIKDVRVEITNLMFERPIPSLRDAIVSFRDHIDEIAILIDDLDKGWPPLQVEAHDVSTLKHLVEVLNKIQRDLKKKDLNLKHILFMRSDVYELLVEETSDRGKYNLIKVDWSDRDQLRHLLRQRVINNIDAENQEAAWDHINPIMEGGVDGVTAMIDISLRRPRFLIDLCERALSFAINRGHGFILPDDIEQASKQMSLYLVSDFAYEMRDIAGTPEDIFYAFIGCSTVMDHANVLTVLGALDLKIDLGELIDLLLWYGFFGIAREGAEPVFIYDRAYDFRRLKAERSADENKRSYAINSAFMMGLSAN